MSLQDPLADMLTRIRNAQAVFHPEVSMVSSKLKKSVAKVLLDEGYIKSYDEVVQGYKKRLLIQLQYHNGKPVIEELKRISRPGLRIYRQTSDLPKVCNGLGVAIISTSKGVITAKSAKSLNIGGEVLATVF